MEKLLKAVSSYAAASSQTLEQVCAALREERYGDACTLMEDLTRVQASTSISMRNMLVKAGLVGGDDDEPS